MSSIAKFYAGGKFDHRSELKKASRKRIKDVLQSNELSALEKIRNIFEVKTNLCKLLRLIKFNKY